MRFCVACPIDLKKNFVGIFLLASIVGLCIFVSQDSIRVVYHSWRMDVEYNTIFGDPQLIGNGLAAFDVTDVDVSGVLLRYQKHRQRLIDLGALKHLTASYSSLATKDSDTASENRSDFLERMWDTFPSHRHFDLAADGTFSTWIVPSDVHRWNQFLACESENGLSM